MRRVRYATQVTVVGDLFCLLGAFAIMGYLNAGRHVRAWLPVFMYALPVTAVAALLLTLVAAVVERAPWSLRGPAGLFGYWTSRAFWYILYLALGPGIVGHTGFNWLLRFLTSFVISMAFPLEPVIGTVMAWSWGLAPPPDALTWLGGTIMILALAYCTYCESARVAQRETRRAVERETADAFDAASLERFELATFTLEGEEDGSSGPDAVMFDSL